MTLLLMECTQVFPVVLARQPAEYLNIVLQYLSYVATVGRTRLRGQLGATQCVHRATG